MEELAMWKLCCKWYEEDGLIEWYEHSFTGETMSVDEFFAFKKEVIEKCLS